MIKKDFISSKSRVNVEYHLKLSDIHNSIKNDLEWIVVLITIFTVYIILLLNNLGDIYV